MEWLDTNQLKIVPPKKPKKITGTRFAAIMGKNTWNTPFKTWCEITRTYEEPFEDTVYTIAGKTIEPKQAEYMRRAYFMTGMKTPTDIFGENYFKRTFGDFFKDDPKGELRARGGADRHVRRRRSGEVHGGIREAA